MGLHHTLGGVCMEMKSFAAWLGGVHQSWGVFHGDKEFYSTSGGFCMEMKGLAAWLGGSAWCRGL